MRISDTVGDYSVQSTRGTNNPDYLGRQQSAGHSSGHGPSEPNVSRGDCGIEPLDDQLADHPHEARMIGHHVRSDHVDAQLVAQPRDFHVEVIDDFHVLRQETDRHDDDVSDALGWQLADAIADVRFEPRLRWRTAAALEGQVPSGTRPLSRWERGDRRKRVRSRADTPRAIAVRTATARPSLPEGCGR